MDHTYHRQIHDLNLDNDSMEGLDVIAPPESAGITQVMGLSDEFLVATSAEQSHRFRRKTGGKAQREDQRQGAADTILDIDLDKSTTTSPIGSPLIWHNSRIVNPPNLTITSLRITSPLSSPALRLKTRLKDGVLPCRIDQQDASPSRSPVSQRLSSPVRAVSPLRPPISPISQRLRSPVKVRFERRSSVEMADAAMARIRDLQAGLFRRISSSEGVLQSAQAVVDACGDAILQWFGSLSGPALESAILESFQKFDEDGSGVIERTEFAKAMHTLGLRLRPEQYDILFKQTDSDGSGEIDLLEFTHMIKKFLKRPCENSCKTCLIPGQSNQPNALFRANWTDDETLLAPAASKLQSVVVAAFERRRYADVVEEANLSASEKEERERQKREAAEAAAASAAAASDSAAAAAEWSAKASESASALLGLYGRDSPGRIGPEASAQLAAQTASAASEAAAANAAGAAS